MRTQCDQHASALSAAPRVLIVDDEPSVRKMLTTLLSQAGVPCSAAANPHEALTMLENTSFQAVISDLRMGSTSGLELLRDRRRRRVETDLRGLANSIDPQNHMRERFDSGSSSRANVQSPAVGKGRQLR